MAGFYVIANGFVSVRTCLTLISEPIELFIQSLRSWEFNVAAPLRDLIVA